MRDGRSLAVLGGTGFFGKSVLDAFRRGLLEPWEITRVVAVSRRPSSFVDRYPDLVGPGVEMLAMDVTAASDAIRLPAVDYVIHAANTTDARAYAADPQRERAAILSAAARFVARASADCPDAAIVYASSGAVYGQQPARVEAIDEDAPFSGADGLAAYKRDYAEAKRAAETMIADYGNAHGARVAVARCFAFVGPYLPRDQHFAIGNFLADGIAGRPVTVNARHPVVRSYLHADDLVRWLMTIAAAATPACRRYNVGSDEAVDVGDLARLIAARYDVPVRVPDDRVGGPIDRYVPSIDRARRELGLSLSLPLDRAIDATIARLAGNVLVRPSDSATSPAVP